jgi:hypothetical protein
MAESCSLFAPGDPSWPELYPSNKPRVPHISLVFREMWDTTKLNPKAFGSLSTRKV